MQIIEKLTAYCRKSIPMHMPGHKRNTELSGNEGYLCKLGADIDITEIDGFDNLHFPCGIIDRSQKEAAALWGSAKTYYIVNGSTSGILSALFACTVNNKKILVSRNCHKSVYNAVRIFELEPIFMMPETDSFTGACGCIRPETVEHGLSENPEIKTVVITSPTYEGIISDIKEIAEIVHGHGAVLIVDEAHGAHLGLYGVFPQNALTCGADIVIESLHKTLPSLTSTAAAHISRNFFDKSVVEEFERALTMFSTSSPSYLLISSIDSCVSLMISDGKKILSKWADNLRFFYSAAKNLKHLQITDPFSYTDRDPSKIIISGMPGGRLADILRNDYKIEVEMAAPYYVIAMTGAGDTRETLGALYYALEEIDNSLCKCSLPRVLPFPQIPERLTSVNEAYRYKTVTVNSVSAFGKISCEYIWSYPPGIPVIVPGEKVTRDISEYIMFCQEAGISLYSDRRGMIEQEKISFLVRED